MYHASAVGRLECMSYVDTQIVRALTVDVSSVLLLFWATLHNIYIHYYYSIVVLWSPWEKRYTLVDNITDVNWKIIHLWPLRAALCSHGYILHRGRIVSCFCISHPSMRLGVRCQLTAASHVCVWKLFGNQSTVQGSWDLLCFRQWFFCYIREAAFSSIGAALMSGVVSRFMLVRAKIWSEVHYYYSIVEEIYISSMDKWLVIFFQCVIIFFSDRDKFLRFPSITLWKNFATALFHANITPHIQKLLCNH
jgi:hypothetical protein